MMLHSFSKRLLLFCFLPFAFCLLLFSCKDKTDTYAFDYKSEYFPLDTGRFIIYDVDSVSSYNSNFVKDTVRYQLMELVSDTTYDNQNELSYVITLYRRPNSSSPWVLDRRWHAKKTLYNAQKVEDDDRFIKLVFPVQQAKTWDGNIYLPTETDPYKDFRNWEYTYETVDVPYSINGFNFDSSVTVSEVDDENFISKKLRKEVYAKHVGMIYQEYELRSKQSVEKWDTARSWNGFSIRMRMIDHN